VPASNISIMAKIRTELLDMTILPRTWELMLFPNLTS